MTRVTGNNPPGRPELPPHAAAANALAAMRRPASKRGHHNTLAITAAVTVFFGHAMFELTGTALIFYVACAFMTAVCGYYALSSLFRGEANIGALIASQTMLWYALPFSYIGVFGYDNYVTMYPYLEIENARSVSMVVFVSIFVYLIFEKFGRSVSVRDISLEWRSCLPLVLPILLAQIYLMAAGDRGYAAVTKVYDADEPSLVHQFVVGFSLAIMPICSCTLAKILTAPRGRRSMLGVLFCLSAMGVEMMWWSVAGRRHMTIIVLISLVSFFMVYFHGEMNKRRIITVMAAGAILAPVMWFFWESYYVLRIATDITQGQENLSFFDLERARQLAIGTDTENQFIENIVSRPFLLVTSLTVVRDTASGVLWGWNIVSQALLAIPSILFPGKLEFIGPVRENLWAALLGVPEKDWSNTILLEGYVDFGWAGFLIYTALLSALLSIFFKASRRTGSAPIVAYTYFSICFSVLNVETGPNFIFVTLRSVLLIILIGFVLTLFRARPRCQV